MNVGTYPLFDERMLLNLRAERRNWRLWSISYRKPHTSTAPNVGVYIPDDRGGGGVW